MNQDAPTDLQTLLLELTNTSSLTDDEVKDELRAVHVDITAGKARFASKLDALFAERAIRARTAPGRAPSARCIARKVAEVRALALTVDELARRIREMAPLVIYCDLTAVAKSDLETEYAEVLVLEAAEEAEEAEEAAPSLDLIALAERAVRDEP